MDPSESQFYFIGHEGTASRDIQLFNGNSMTKVVSIFMPSPPPPTHTLKGSGTYRYGILLVFGISTSLMVHVSQDPSGHNI